MSLAVKFGRGSLLIEKCESLLPAHSGILVVSEEEDHAACPNGEKLCTYWFRRRVPAALLCPFSAGNETASRQAGGRAAVGGTGKFSYHPDGRWTNREL